MKYGGTKQYNNTPISDFSLDILSEKNIVSESKFFHQENFTKFA